MLELDVFSLVASGEIRAYAEVFAVGQIDPNSTPANGNGVTANEDDEAVLSFGTSARNNFVVSRSGVTMNKIFPVPTNKALNISFFNENVGQDAVISVYDFQGRILISETSFLEQGVNTYRLDVTRLVEGNYFLHIQTSGETLTVKQFTKVDK